MSKYESVAEMFKSMGDEGRVRVLERLLGGEANVSQIAELHGENLSLVSQRLHVLLKAKMVSRRKIGKFVYYQLRDKHVEALIKNALQHASEC